MTHSPSTWPKSRNKPGLPIDEKAPQLTSCGAFAFTVTPNTHWFSHKPQGEKDDKLDWF